MGSYEIQPPVEVVPGLILGSLRALNDILDRKPDVLFPLDRLPGWVWETGFRGEIVYYPITDYEALPDDVLDGLVAAVLERLQAGKRVAVFSGKPHCLSASELQPFGGRERGTGTVC